jgi:hypothetical protein
MAETEERTQDNEELEVMAVIETLASNLLKKRNEAVEFRAASGIERMWREDDESFDGGDGYTNSRNMIEYATGEAYIKQGHGPKRSQVIVNITRGKCETIEGRFSDILVPVDDRNWGLKETPVPKISAALKDDRVATKIGANTPVKDKGIELKMSDVAKNALDGIKEKMKLMETEIDDQLTECKYNAEMRKLISDSSRTGTGIIRGPNIVKKIRKVWVPQKGETKTVHNLETSEEHTPSSERVSCWDIYPDPDVGEDISRAAYIWESDNIRSKELRDLYGVPGYINKQIISILQEDPIRLRVGYSTRDKRHKIRRTTASQGNLYEKWIYNGDLDRDDLEAMGIDLSHDEIAQSFSACVVFVNERPIKVCLNMLDTGDLPYDFFQWTQIKDSPWGIGIPRMMMWLQKILTAAWRAMMDNAGDSSGANVVIGPGIEPVDGVWELTGKKIWRMIEEYEDGGDVRKAFQQFQVENNQQDLEKIIELVLKFVDLETSVPTIFQGEQQKIPETLGATNIMVDANNVGLRGRVKRFDDQITVPHLSRYYHWNMQYNDKSEIKGDYNVDPRGTSVLLQKDRQAQTLASVMSYKEDKDVNLLVDWEKAIKQLFAALGLDILKSEEDYKKAKDLLAKTPPPQDPRLETAKIKSDTDLKKATITQESDMREIETKGNLTEKELAFKAQEADKDREHTLILKSMERDIKMMEFAEKRNMSLDQIKAKLADSSAKLKTQIYLAGPDKEGPQITKPPVEPEGRAKDGRAYQD